MNFGFLPPRLTNAGLSCVEIIPPKTDPSHKVALLATLEKSLRGGVRPFLRRASNIQHNFSKTWIFANCPRIKLPKFAHFCPAVSTLDDTPWNYQIITWSRNKSKVPNIKDKDDVSLPKSLLFLFLTMQTLYLLFSLFLYFFSPAFCNFLKVFLKQTP